MANTDKTDEVVEAPVVEAPAVTTVAPVEAAPTRVVELRYDFRTNSTTYKKGTVEVSEEVAEDLERRQVEQDEVERKRFIPETVVLQAGALDAQGK
jgi:fibronectin type 3 domain-containing protein